LLTKVDLLTVYFLILVGIGIGHATIAQDFSIALIIEVVAWLIIAWSNDLMIILIFQVDFFAAIIKLLFLKFFNLQYFLKY
jgi:hypothetical protein